MFHALTGDKKKRRIYISVAIAALGVGGTIFSILPPLTYFNLESLTPGQSFQPHETVDFWAIVCVAVFVVPCIVYIIRKASEKKEILIDGTLECYFGMITSNFIVNFLKYVVGKKRPDYNSRIEIYKYGRRFLDGRRSFPSGHSACAVACAFFIVTASLEGLKKSKASTEKAIIIYSGVILPIIGAGIVCGSRILDNRHDIIDVLSGMIIAVTACSAVKKIIKVKNSSEHI